MTGDTGSHPRVVRYAELIPCTDAFIDTRTPGSDRKENFTIIGPGVSENPNQHIHIAEPHGFNIGGARQPAGCVNSQHSHETAEVFFVHSGTWEFRLGETGEDAAITLVPGDLISIPTHVFRGFENVGDDIGFLWAVLGGDDPGRVLWAPHVFDMAEEYGLVLLSNGNLIDIASGQIIPEGEIPMPRTSLEDVAALQRFDNDALAACCVQGEAAKGVHFIGPDAPLAWEHGFTLDRFELSEVDIIADAVQSVADVVFVHGGILEVTLDDHTLRLEAGDTLTIPKGVTRRFHTPTQAEFIRVLGT